MAGLNVFHVNFLPLSFGGGFYASLIGMRGAAGYLDDGWPENTYNGLSGVAVDFTPSSPWEETVHERLLENGVVFLSPDGADEYCEGEGAYWLHFHSLPRRKKNSILSRLRRRIYALGRKTPISDLAESRFKARLGTPA